MPARVLVVEDDPDTRHLLADVLLDAGYAVFTARDGLDGLQRAAEWRPDLILLDLLMPASNGWAFVDVYRATSPNPAPIIVVTGHPLERATLPIGVADALAKPIDLDRLVETVALQLDAAA